MRHGRRQTRVVKPYRATLTGPALAQVASGLPIASWGGGPEDVAFGSLHNGPNRGAPSSHGSRARQDIAWPNQEHLSAFRAPGTAPTSWTTTNWSGWGLRHLLAAAGIAVLGESGPALQAVRRIPALRPQVAILDENLPDGTGTAVCRGLRAADPSIRCLILAAPIVAAPIVGASKEHHLTDAAAALDITLTADEVTALEAHYTLREPTYY